MRIDRLDVYYVRMPLIYPWRTAYGEDHDIPVVSVQPPRGGASQAEEEAEEAEAEPDSSPEE